MNPYLTLRVPNTADDQHIRQAYLSSIRQATPESDPERFKLLTQAYERIKDESSRHHYELFGADSGESSPLEAFLNHFRTSSARPEPLPPDSIRELLRSFSPK